MTIISATRVTVFVTLARNVLGSSLAENVTADSDCASGSCDGGTGSGCSGTCGVKVPIGGSCNADIECQSNRCLCNQCRPLGARTVVNNGQCQTDSDCMGNFCDGATETSCGRCQSRVANGEECGRSNSHCRSGRCLCGTCRAQGSGVVPENGNCKNKR